MLEVWLPAVGCSVLGCLQGIKHSHFKRPWPRLVATACVGLASIGYIKAYRGDKNWFHYVAYAKQPTYLKKNFPFYVSTYCGGFCAAYVTRESYLRFMSRYLLPKLKK
mmetsp:Transcript_9097/g.22271  ORF Transcript_9097/g.22271 Transcript_9097/m.22271 type:complete len:108 (-) Transcript_9097:692-1015(-)|eukprot:g6119.t1